jgi:hypothetical protein
VTRNRLIALLLLLLIVWLAPWVAERTEWADTTVPIPWTGEAVENPFYAAQRFAEALGARTSWARTVETPAANAVVVLSAWHWNLSNGRRERLQRWVQSGGRLVIDNSVVGLTQQFAQWSGIEWQFRGADEDELDDGSKAPELCRRFSESPKGGPTAGYSPFLCDFDTYSWLSTRKAAMWALGEGRDLQALRVGVGSGSVTVVNATPFTDRSLFDGDHGALLVRALQLRRGDEVVFLSEEDRPSLPALLWQHAASVVMLGIGAIGAMLWRAMARFGPMAPPDSLARRSLAEQIRGTSRFTLRHDGGSALHAASVRALNEAAARRIALYSTLPAAGRAATLATLTGLPEERLAGAMTPPATGGPDVRLGLQLLETARRQIVAAPTGTSHGHDQRHHG